MPLERLLGVALLVVLLLIWSVYNRRIALEKRRRAELAEAADREERARQAAA